MSGTEEVLKVTFLVPPPGSSLPQGWELSHCFTSNAKAE